MARQGKAGLIRKAADMAELKSHAADLLDPARKVGRLLVEQAVDIERGCDHSAMMGWLTPSPR